MIDLRPRHQVGYLLPVDIADAIYYQFSRVFPRDVLLVGYPLALTGFYAPDVDAALEHFWEGVDFLASRGVERIVQGGIPVSALAGRERIQQLVAEAGRRTGLPVSADFEESIDAFHELGVRRVAVAAKWDEQLMQGVADYLSDAGLEVVGTCAERHTAQEVVALTSDDGIDLALRLGREAFLSAPTADGLLLAGGAWLSLHAVPILEAEFGRPVITNPSATFWAAMRQFGISSPDSGWGRLIDGLRGDVATAALANRGRSS